MRAHSSAGAFGPLPLSMINLPKPEPTTQRPISITIWASVWGCSETVPGQRVVWPSEIPYGMAGRTTTPVRSETRQAISSGEMVSQPVARCGPCCSVAPTGSSARSMPFATASPISPLVINSQRRGPCIGFSRSRNDAQFAGPRAGFPRPGGGSDITEIGEQDLPHLAQSGRQIVIGANGGRDHQSIEMGRYEQRRLHRVDRTEHAALDPAIDRAPQH